MKNCLTYFKMTPDSGFLYIQVMVRVLNQPNLLIALITTLNFFYIY